MKLTFKYLTILSLVLCTRVVSAQTGFSETITSFAENKTESGGNDFWFTPLQNFSDNKGQYIRIYISSLTHTTAYIESGGHTVAVDVPAYSGKDSNSVAAFDVPASWEIQSSGIVENKAIHVWSSTANLSVYLMSHTPYSSDGFYCIPTQELGLDYVVAGYESFWCGFGCYAFDLPSEFTITATHDNTTVQITPNADLRQAPLYPGGNSVVAFPKGKQFSVTLDRGQAVQYQTLRADDYVNYDVTGTIINSNYPVGVVSGAMMANVPIDFDYGDYLCDMMPPVSGWGEIYYTTNPVQPQGMSGHDFGMYCLISSVPNQEIDRTDCQTGKHVEAVLGPKYDHLFVEEESANKWSSNAPFLLIQYINSSTYPDNINGNGDPAEVVINHVENFAKTVLFQSPASVGAQPPYDSYANVFVNVNDTKNTTIDGKKITNFSSQCIDGKYEVFIVPHLKAGAHQVVSDSGVGVYLYGYGYDETYAWAGSLGQRVPYHTTPKDTSAKDTIAPTIAFVDDSLCLHILLSDTGSGLSIISPDSISNLSFSLDTSFSSGNTSAFVDICVTDRLKTGYLRLEVEDTAGNISVAIIIYTHPPIVSAPGFAATSVSFDTVLAGTQKSLPVLTITDTSTQYPITIDRIYTLTTVFTFDGVLPENKLPITLSPLESHTFTIAFHPAGNFIYSYPVFVVSNELTATHVDTLKGIGYSVADVSRGARTEVHATLTPNPAAKSISLNFSLPQTASVTFELSSIAGNKVLAWKAEAQSGGEHQQKFDISSLPSGSYIYRFEMDDRSSTNNQVLSGKLIINR